MTDGLLTPGEVAERLGVTVRTVQRWIAEGRLPATRVGGRSRVSHSSLSLVLTGEAVVAAPAAGRPSPGPLPAIRTLLVANRGEIAARIARTARRLGLRTVGVHEPDDRAPDGMDEVREIASYLDAAGVIGAAKASGADAIHPGYGFLSENAGFAAGVAGAGLTWVGPPPEAIAAMGDKAAARRRASHLGVPTLPGYDGQQQDDPTLIAAADRVGYPILVKPAAGGGGKGMRVVRSRADLPDALAAARREALRAFGDDRLVLERFLHGPRHVEIQLLFDRHGEGIHLGERDCSAQRRNQKIAEESPAPSISAELRDRMGAAALTLAADVGYAGVGTVEFLVADGGFFFLEMNTRLQVEHAVTEAVTGRDLVADQLRVAAGEPLRVSQREISLRGHAMEVRLYAEDPESGFLPATGQVLALRWPQAPNVRIDAGVRHGDRVTDRYDPMLAKIVVHSATRERTLDALARALAETRLLGLRTNLRFLRWLLDQPAVRSGEMRTDTIAGSALPRHASPSDDAWGRAAAELLRTTRREGDPWRGGWRANAPAVVRLEGAGTERRVELSGAPPMADDVVVDGATAYVDVEGQSVELRLASPPSVEEAVRHAAAVSGHAVLTAPMPGRVISLRTAEGQEVAEHQALVVIEAMKMEHAVATPIRGRVSRIMVDEGQQVERGTPLVEVTAAD